ncbi:D-amino-acid transaminase [Neobacillus mesonae]|uniref:D-amino-acid transaminase n=1 Tax=Neobacillus mesonae TaxID=1193713 RepID=UPI002E215AFF|nr:D-amino-acid transaminase [Neobacillus mesonae]MED4203026.1 D-amino-acid transaminase [Neobacillus mesonae]
MKYAIVNDHIINREEAKVDIEDRGYQFGDGVYEVIRVYNGKMFTVKEHMERFVRSAESIGIKIPYASENITKMLEDLIEKDNLKLGIVYMQITRGAAPRNHAFPSGDVVPVITAYTKEMPIPEANLQSGVKTILTEDIRWLRCDIKSLNLLGNILAKQKAAEQGCYEAIQHRGQDVTEGSSSNVYIVKNGTVITHESNNLILKGITKDVILKVCAENEIPVEERTFSLEELAQADEVFLSSTTSEVTPIVVIDEKKVGTGSPGPITKKLQALFKQEIENQCGII